MTDRPKVVHGMTMDGGFGKIQPLTEGYIAKGGRNLSSKIVERPPAPPVLTKGGQAPAPTATAERK
jgi:hypothetical protein